MWSLNHLHRSICPEIPKIQTTHAGGPSPCLDYQRIFQRNYWHSVFFVDHKRMLKSRQGKKNIKNVIPLNLIFCFPSMYILATYKPCQTDGEKNKSQRFITKLSECKMSIVKPLNSGNIWMWLTTDLQQKRTFRLPETKHGIFPKSHLFAHNSLKIYDWMSLSAFSQNSCISLLSAGHNKQICYVLSYLWDIWTQHSIDTSLQG